LALLDEGFFILAWRSLDWAWDGLRWHIRPAAASLEELSPTKVGEETKGDCQNGKLSESDAGNAKQSQANPLVRQPKGQ